MNHFVKIGHKISNVVLHNINHEYVDYMREENMESIIMKNSQTGEHISFTLDDYEILDTNLDEHSMEEFFDTIDEISFTFGYSLPNDQIKSLKFLLMDNIKNWERKMLSLLKNINGFRLVDIEYVECYGIQDIYLNFKIKEKCDN